MSATAQPSSVDYPSDSRVDNRIDSKAQLESLAHIFLNSESNNKSIQLEIEAKFGTTNRHKFIKPISKIDYNNVVTKLKSLNYKVVNSSGFYSLRATPEFIDIKTGKQFIPKDINNFRVEIDGINAIREYCNTDKLSTVYSKFPSAIKVGKKSNILFSSVEHNLTQTPNTNPKGFISSADFNDFNFKVSLKREEYFPPSDTNNAFSFMVDNWVNSKKTFRYLNRVSFVHDDYPFSVDISLVRTSDKDPNDNRKFGRYYRIEESNVFTNPFHVEIEIEALQESKIKYKNNVKQFVIDFQKTIKTVLAGLQTTNFPVSYTEQYNVLQNYLKLIKRPSDNIISSAQFIGPSSKSLQIINLTQKTDDVKVICVTEPEMFCVTDKADGLRALLFVNTDGKIYLILSNMSVVFTGVKTINDQLFNSLFDGELILHDKYHSFINMFACFDVYYINGVDVRMLPFMQINSFKSMISFVTDTYLLQLLDKYKSRLHVMRNGLTQLNAQSVIAGSKPNITIVPKKFVPLLEGVKQNPDIFKACDHILGLIKEGNTYSYDIDGIIFTPTTLGVGSSKPMSIGKDKFGKNGKVTWEYSFKWKPSEATETFPKSYNTIDFLVRTKKDNKGHDIITPIFEKGINNASVSQLKQYKTLILMVGYNELIHGFQNPLKQLLTDDYELLTEDNEKNRGKYDAKQFYPSDPVDVSAGLTNIMLSTDDGGNSQLMTEEGEVFDDDMIVEFRYEITAPNKWRWIPMRVRYDKTSEYKQGHPMFGNDYNTANSNWYSIHNPITETMIRTGDNIPTLEVADDVYYNRTTEEKYSASMRDFHNLFVKMILITRFGKPDGTIIDFACGKGGDMSKWIASKARFVFGIDISKDNIENRIDGACQRYLKNRYKFAKMPYMLFAVGSSAENIRSGTNMKGEIWNDITNCIFGNSTKEKAQELGSAVFRQFSIGINGFNLSSCQFAIHYMFENDTTLSNFARNVGECTHKGGYFIATTYNGDLVFKALAHKKIGEQIEINDATGRKMWSIKKLYDDEEFNLQNCVGKKIAVYQDTINQTIEEYLVKPEKLIKEMQKYGMELITNDEARHKGLKTGMGNFRDLFEIMKSLPKSEMDKYGKSLYMTDQEKRISFLNNYYIFKKVHNVTDTLNQMKYENVGGGIDEEQAREHLKQMFYDHSNKGMLKK